MAKGQYELKKSTDVNGKITFGILFTEFNSNGLPHLINWIKEGLDEESARTYMHRIQENGGHQPKTETIKTITI